MKKNHTKLILICAVGVIGFLFLFHFVRMYFLDLPTDSQQKVEPEVSDIANASETINDDIQQIGDLDPEENLAKNNEENSEDPISEPTKEPSSEPTPEPTLEPSIEPTLEPTLHPTDWDYMDTGYGNMPYPEDESIEEFPYEIRINKQKNAVTIYQKNKNGEYKKPIKAMVCSVGTATPIGTFQLKEKYYWKSLIHDVWGQYSTRITGRVLFHSVPYSEPKKDKLMSNLYRQLGYTASAGCVRLTTIDAKWILENCPTGTTVVIYSQNNPGPLGKPEAPNITTNLGWDPTDPDTRNPLHLKTSQLKGVKDRTVERGISVNYLDGVVAFDKAAMSVSNNVKVKTDLDINQVGTYPVKFVFTDSNGKKFQKEVTFTVKDTTPPTFSGLPSVYYIKDAKDVSKKSLLSQLNVTDNGNPMDIDDITVNMPKSIKEGTNSVTFSISDEYGNEGTFSCKVILVTKPPVLTFKVKNKDVLPITQKVNKEYAKTRVTVKDDVTNITPDDLKIDTQKKNWGYKIKYTAVNKAGLTATISETVTYETYHFEVKQAKTKTVSSIKKNKELISFVKVKSDLTNKTVNSKVQVKYKLTKSDDKFDFYTVTYQCTYKSPTGSKTITAKTDVQTPTKKKKP